MLVGVLLLGSCGSDAKKKDVAVCNAVLSMKQHLGAQPTHEQLAPYLLRVQRAGRAAHGRLGKIAASLNDTKFPGRIGARTEDLLFLQAACKKLGVDLGLSPPQKRGSTTSAPSSSSTTAKPD